MQAILVFCFLLSIQNTVIKETSTHPKKEPSDTILYVFSGSDWCANCIDLEKKIISDPLFQSSLKIHHIQLQVIDFPQRKKLKAEVVKYNNSIAEKFNFDGVYPTLIVFSSDSKKYKQVAFQNESVEAFLNKIIREASHLYE